MLSKLSKTCTRTRQSLGKSLVFPPSTAPTTAKAYRSASGKQAVYHAIQDPNETLSLEELTAMDKQIADLREEISTAKSNEKLLRAGLAAANATMSVEDLQTSISSLEQETEEILGRLGPLRAGTVPPVSSEEKEKVEQEWQEWTRKANVRKRICMEVWAFVTEEMEEGKTREELWV